MHEQDSMSIAKSMSEIARALERQNKLTAEMIAQSREQWQQNAAQWLDTVSDREAVRRRIEAIYREQQEWMTKQGDGR